MTKDEIPNDEGMTVNGMNKSNLCRRLLIALAVAFVLSAWLYCLATIHTMRLVKDSQPAEPVSGVIAFFRDNGARVLVAELAGLAVCAAVMVVTDRQPARRGNRSGTDRCRAPTRSTEEKRQDQPSAEDDENRWDRHR